MSWTPLKFGKHKGKTLPQVLFADPDWFFWAIDNNVFSKGPQSLRNEAEALNKKARNIRIPPTQGKQVEVEYVVHSPSGKFSHFTIVDASRPSHQGSGAYRGNVIDMSFPRAFAQYDKFGCRLLVKSLKYWVLGDEKIRMAKRRCEEFFDTATNFKEDP